MDASSDRLLGLAASVSDGAPVDWETAEGGAANEGERAVVRELRLVADVALACREGDAEPLPVPSRWGPLDILERLGAGGFGEVYRAWDARLRREVALKLLRAREPAAHARSWLLEEGRLLAQVHHPNVVTVHGADLIDGRVGIWMELVPGRTLARALQQDGPFDASDAASIGIDLAGALRAIHDAGLIHGDVKAENVMREDGGRVVLMDPGAGRAGTPLYLAPELRAGARPTPRSDVYALGVLLHHMVTRAFPEDGAARPAMPTAFGEVVQRAIAPDPADRYASASNLEAALRVALHPRPPRRLRRRWLFVTSLALGIVALVTLAWLRPVISRPPTLTLTPAQQDLVRALDRLAGLRAAMGSYAEAARFYERAENVYETRLGPDHVEVADRLRQRAWVLRALGSHDEARALLQRALAIYEKRLGEEHATVVATLADLAGLYEEMGAAAKARPLEERAQRIRGDRPAVDPFVPPLAATASFDAQVARPPSGDGPYSIELTPEKDSAHRLWLRIRSSRPLYLYVLSEDDAGRCSLVFPLPGQERENPVPPRVPQRLPGSLGWRRAGLGRSLVVIAGPERLLEFENELRAERVPAGAPVETVPLSPATLSRLQESARVDASPRLFEAARPAPEHLEIVRGLWIRRIDLGFSAARRSATGRPGGP